MPVFSCAIKRFGFGRFVSAWKPLQGNNELYVAIELG